MNFTRRRYASAGISRRRVSVCLSVCLCVTRRYCIKTAERRITQTTPRDIPGTLVFWCQQSLVGNAPFPWNLYSKWPTPFWTQRFRPISAHSASTVRASEMCSIITNRKSTMHFPSSHRWTLCVTPKQRMAQNENFYILRCLSYLCFR